MVKYRLPEYLEKKYSELKDDIARRLQDFREVPAGSYFYEMCYCMCTPQSKAKNAFIVQKKLEAMNFLEKGGNPAPILRDPAHYIRFHNQKAARLLELRALFPDVMKILDCDVEQTEKRILIHKAVKGFGFKESSHFMRNIGYRGFAILDRHILRHMAECGVYKEIPSVSSLKSYIEVEKSFIRLAENAGIGPDELDILFWSYETGEILK